MIFLKNAVDFMVKAKMPYMELPVWETFNIKDSNIIKRILGELVECYSIHFPKTVSINQLLADEAFLEAIQDLSPKIIVVHPERGSDFLKSIDSLQERLINSVVTIEYLPYERDIKDILESMDQHYQITLDLYHCQAGGVDWKACFKRFSSRIRHLHVRDMKYEISNSNNIFSDNGSIELNDLLLELNEIDYQGVLMYESKISNEFEIWKLLTDFARRRPYETGDGICQ